MTTTVPAIIVGFRLRNYGFQLYTEVTSAYGPFVTQQEIAEALAKLQEREMLARRMNAARSEIQFYVSSLSSSVDVVDMPLDATLDVTSTLEVPPSEQTGGVDDEEDEDEDEDDEDEKEDDDGSWITVP